MLIETGYKINVCKLKYHFSQSSETDFSKYLSSKNVVKVLN